MSTENDTDALDGEVIDFEMGPMIPVEPERTAIVPIEPTPAALLSQALEKGLDPDTLQKFMDLSDRFEANEARKAYADDMAKCQAEMQPIAATAENDHTTSYYAKLGTINKQITPVYAKHGFSISFGQGVPAIDGEIRTTARVLHRMGHYEDFHVDFPPDGVGSAGNTNKTPIHARQSSNTYGKRSIVMGIFNLSILSEDDDANLAGGAGAGKITEEQALQLHAMVEENGLIHSAIHREFGVKTYDELKATKFEKAVNRITQLAQARGGKR